MDHGDQKHTQCPHRRCLNHGPEWENIGSKWLEPKSVLFGLWRIWFSVWCCRRPMSRYVVVQTQQCRKCRRMRDNVIFPRAALCYCCGRHSSLRFANTLGFMERVEANQKSWKPGSQEIFLASPLFLFNYPKENYFSKKQYVNYLLERSPGPAKRDEVARAEG